MAVRYNEAASNGILTSGFSIFDEGAIAYYDGTQPAEGGGSIGGSTLLASGTLPDPAFAAASDRGRGPASNWDAVGEESVDDETIGWARITGTGGAILDLAVGTTGEDINFSSVTVSEDDIVRINDGAIILPGNDV